MHVVKASDQSPPSLLSGDNRGRLEKWLAAQAGASRVAVTEDGRLGGGAISLNLAVTLDIDGGPLARRHACPPPEE